jgi:hypothetical protein
MTTYNENDFHFHYKYYEEDVNLFLERAGIRPKGTEPKKVLKRTRAVIYGYDLVEIIKVSPIPGSNPLPLPD